MPETIVNLRAVEVWKFLVEFERVQAVERGTRFPTPFRFSKMSPSDWREAQEFWPVKIVPNDTGLKKTQRIIEASFNNDLSLSLARLDMKTICADLKLTGKNKSVFLKLCGYDDMDFVDNPLHLNRAARLLDGIRTLKIAHRTDDSEIAEFERLTAEYSKIKKRANKNLDLIAQKANQLEKLLCGFAMNDARALEKLLVENGYQRKQAGAAATIFASNFPLRPFVEPTPGVASLIGSKMSWPLLGSSVREQITSKLDPIRLLLVNPPERFSRGRPKQFKLNHAILSVARVFNSWNIFPFRSQSDDDVRANRIEFISRALSTINPEYSGLKPRNLRERLNTLRV